MSRIEVEDGTNDGIGKFVRAAIQNYPSYTGKHIYAATEYYTPARLMSEFSEVLGKPAKAVQITPEQYRSFLSPAMAQEMLENMLLLEEPGYYGGADLGESLGLLSEQPTSWKSFVEKNKEKWL